MHVFPNWQRFRSTDSASTTPKFPPKAFSPTACPNIRTLTVESGQFTEAEIAQLKLLFEVHLIKDGVW
jgi:hypothetical protein